MCLVIEGMFCPPAQCVLGNPELLSMRVGSCDAKGWVQDVIVSILV